MRARPVAPGRVPEEPAFDVVDDRPREQAVERARDHRREPLVAEGRPVECEPEGGGVQELAVAAEAAVLAVEAAEDLAGDPVGRPEVGFVAVRATHASAPARSG